MALYPPSDIIFIHYLILMNSLYWVGHKVLAQLLLTMTCNNVQELCFQPKTLNLQTTNNGFTPYKSTLILVLCQTKFKNIVIIFVVACSVLKLEI